jgi:hypothetical protein
VVAFTLPVYKAPGLLFVDDMDLTAIAEYALESAEHACTMNADNDTTLERLSSSYRR